MSTIKLKRTTVTKQKGRLEAPPLFDARKLPEHHLKQLNIRLAEIFTANTQEGDTENETAIQPRD